MKFLPVSLSLFWLYASSLVAGQFLEPPRIGISYDIYKPIVLKMGQTKELTLSLTLNTALIQRINSKLLDLTNASVMFQVIPEIPKFPILKLINGSELRPINKNMILQDVNITLEPLYIGHAIIEPIRLVIQLNQTTVRFEDPEQVGVPVTVIEDEGIYGDIFGVSVTLLLVLSFMSLGTQLDLDSLKRIVREHKTIIVGTFLTILVMPYWSSQVCRWLLDDQTLSKIGSFIFACGPPASASTLWTTMLGSDKELSVALQVFSTLGSLIAMPLLLHFRFDHSELHRGVTLKVPHVKLAQGSLMIILALFVGKAFIARSERAKKISLAIFRPLTIFILIYIIVFSSIIYWYLYKMFNWTITIACILITLGTYITTFLLGFLIDFNLDHAIAISISSIYKNSGVSFAVLLVAFDNPDLYIAFVPCLTQVILTSLTLYLVYTAVKLIGCFWRRGQPEPIIAEHSTTDEEVNEAARTTRSGSTSERSINNDEMVAMIASECVEPDQHSQIQETSLTRDDESLTVDSDSGPGARV